MKCPLFADQGTLCRLNHDLKTISSPGLERAARSKRELVGYSSEGGSIEELRIDDTLKCVEIWLDEHRDDLTRL